MCQYIAYIYSLASKVRVFSPGGKQKSRWPEGVTIATVGRLRFLRQDFNKKNNNNSNYLSLHHRFT